MRRTLMAWIGLTDLRAAENNPVAFSGPILSALQQRDYDQLVLLSNFATADNERFGSWIRGLASLPVAIEEVRLTSPTNFEEIYRGAVEVIDRLLERGQVHLTFHISPGTPAMAAVWIILAKTKYAAELIESSIAAGVQTVAIPFEMSAEFLPDVELERFSIGQAPVNSGFEDLIFRSEVMGRLVDLARRVAPRQIPILLEGESGTGKELLARAIHRASPRVQGPFIAVNCGAIPLELVEAELFGHEKGAFTGAFQKRDGHFISANGGTIFLDEVGDLPLGIQVKLLRVLQENEVTPLGSSRPRRLNVRVISATNRSMIEETSHGRFREDLFYRLAVAILPLPPLRKRGEDVGLLIDHTLARLNRESEQLDLGRKSLSPGARNLLLGHNWPGNIRELQNTLLRASVLARRERIGEKEVREAILRPSGKRDSEILNRRLGNGFKLPEVLGVVASHYLERALNEAHGNRTEAAGLVGLPSYQTLNNWLKRYGVDEDTS
jgi:DNA-binding NtrC family response regulator